MYPITRLRRNRRTAWLRDMTAETNLSPADLILPLFLVEGTNIKQEVEKMPGVYRYSIDNIITVVQDAASLGIKAVALFPAISNELKTDEADEAYNLDNLICRAVRSLKNANIDIGIICDVALDPYTNHGHDGIVIDGDVDNDATIEALSNQALVLAKAGADIVAPSDMMDGRIMQIRENLDSEGFINVNIVAYAAKYASSFYGPFRAALGNDKKDAICKASYQMDARNSREAMREIEQDLHEGADMIIVKPAMHYLDIIKEATARFDAPVLAYQVSGEYAMIRCAAQNGSIIFEKAMMESLICAKRAGASAILTYSALETAKLLN